MRVAFRSIAGFLATVGLVLGASAPARAQATYAITKLPVLPGATSCTASAISDEGSVAGSCAGAGSFGEQAVAWHNGEVAGLGTLRRGNYSVAHAVNVQGVVVGEGDTGDFRPHPTLHRNGAVVDIDATGGNARAIFITETGVIVGNYAKGLSGNTSAWSAVIWTERAGKPGRFTRVSLPPYPGGSAKARHGYAMAANNGVQVVGYVQNSLFGQRGAFWNNDPAHTLALLEPLPGDWTSVAWGVNDLGQAVGDSHPPFRTRAVLWLDDAGHTPVDLGTLPGDTDSTAMAINNLGQIIGHSTSASGTVRSFLWENGQIVDLGSLLDASGADWVIQGVTAINNHGQIVGFGLLQGVSSAFVLTPR